MDITFDKENKVFYLATHSTSYIMQIFKDKYLAHLYWGRRLNKICPENVLVPKNLCGAGNPDHMDKTYTLDHLPQEYATFGASDYRKSALEITYGDGSTMTELYYESHRIYKGKPEINGLPAVYVEDESEATTLEIVLREQRKLLEVTLIYTVMEAYDVITRSVRVKNNSAESVILEKVYSALVDFNHDEFDMITLNGAWGRERYPERVKVRRGEQSVGSVRGASSHQANPFIALVSPQTTEEAGDAYGFNFVYSGNFSAGAQVDQNSFTRAFMGLNENMFSWELKSGEVFETPEVVMVYSAKGLGGMSRIYHKVYRERLCRGQYRDSIRPVLVNNWEGTYFDFTHEKIVDIAKKAKELGIELLVLDDGWFGKRKDDTTSLGDWFADKDKLPQGIEGLAKEVHALGLKFGLWFEPEMVSKVSELYKAHPDWCIHEPGREPIESRNQLILDYSRSDVREYIVNIVSGILESADIDYVKWDMNRHMTEFFSVSLDAKHQKELCHRYMLGLYEVLEQITQKHPKVLFESCSSGGGRFEPGMLYYMPQTWTSDDTDGVERLFIQHGTSYVYPFCTMGAHVSAIPNHQVHREVPLKMRGDVAMPGNFGYELDLTKFTAEESLMVKEQILRYKELRTWLPKAQLYRLESPFEGNTAVWEFVGEDENRIYLSYFRILERANSKEERVFLSGLAEDALYRCVETDKIYSGAELMYVGMHIDFPWNDAAYRGDYVSVTREFVRQ